MQAMNECQWCDMSSAFQTKDKTGCGILNALQRCDCRRWKDDQYRVAVVEALGRAQLLDASLCPESETQNFAVGRAVEDEVADAHQYIDMYFHLKLTV